MFSYFWNFEEHLHWFVFGVDLGGGIIDVILCTITLAMLRKELTEHRKKQVERMIESGALVVAVLVIVTVVGLERLSTLQDERIAKEIAQAVKPLAFDERLRVCLKNIDTNILVNLANGKTRFEGFISAFKRGELDKLCAEPEASQFIQLQEKRTVHLDSSADGVVIFTAFSLGTNLIKAP